MAIITGNPFKTTSATLKIGADNYEALITASEVVPTSGMSTFAGIGGRKVPVIGKSTYNYVFTFAQDWTTPNSLSLKAFNGEGTSAVFTVVPNNGNPAFTFTAFWVAPNIGGAAEADAMTTLTLPVVDKPVLVV